MKNQVDTSERGADFIPEITNRTREMGVCE